MRDYGESDWSNCFGEAMPMTDRHEKRRSRPPASSISSIDVKLGIRMLAKHPVMTLVSGLAISVTIAVAICTFGLFQTFLMRPTVPLPAGERVVSLGLRDADTNRSNWHLLHEFVVWRDELETIEDLAIWQTDARNIIGEDGRGELAPFGVMSASGFVVARVPPLLGRPLLASDEVEGAPPVVVIGYREWTRRFAGDPDVVGKRMRIGREDHTIVGVMPEGFTFPVAQRFWIPLRDDPDAVPLLGGPDYYVFGRLAPSVTRQQAQAELDLISRRRASALPETHARLAGRVMSYTDPHTGMDNADDNDWIARIVLGVITLVVLIPFANVGILVYARTATRAGEIAVRTALGANRRRVVTQLFVEALVLASVSAAVGVGLASVVLGQLERFLDAYLSSSLPFWAKNGTDPWAIAYVVGITVLAAVVAGVIPGLKATGRSVQTNLRAAGNGMRMGRVWTGLVVTQVGITVAFLPIAGSAVRQAIDIATTKPAFAASEYLGARIGGDAARALGDREGIDNSADAIQEIVRRVEIDPRVAGVAMSTRLPGSAYSSDSRVEVEGIPPHDSGRGEPVGRASVSPDLFDVLRVPLLAGRGFDGLDAEADVLPVIVDETFVREVLVGANPVGRRIRMRPGLEAEPPAWSEIVGVVGDAVNNPLSRREVSGMIYLPLTAADVGDGVRLIVHVLSSSNSFAPELERIAAAVDPTLPISRITRLDSAENPIAAAFLGVAAVIGLVLLSVLLLCSAGVFALMSFNVTQRRREIGIRSALGASPGRVLTKVMMRSVRQLAIGVAVGVLLVAIMPDLSLDGLLVEVDATMIGGVAALLFVVGLLAAAGPARAGLRVHPTEVLREG
jgi:predicted permease